MEGKMEIDFTKDELEYLIRYLASNMFQKEMPINYNDVLNAFYKLQKLEKEVAQQRSR